MFPHNPSFATEPAPAPAPAAKKKRTRTKRHEPPCNLPVYSHLVRAPRSEVLYIRDHAEAERALELLAQKLESTCARSADGRAVLGFDLEWRPTFRRGQPENQVAVVQMATDDQIYLLQVSAMKSFPSKLVKILNDANVVKAGVNILADCRKLHRDYAVSVRSCIELSFLARCVDKDKWSNHTNFRNLISLTTLVQTYELCKLPKGETQLSNWEQELTPIQQHYAANDAHSGLMVCTTLLARARDADPAELPHPSFYTFDVINSAALHANGTVWKTKSPFPEPEPEPKPNPGAAATDGGTTGEARAPDGVPQLTAGFSVLHIYAQ